MRTAVITGDLEACISYDELMKERIDKPDKRYKFEEKLNVGALHS